MVLPEISRVPLTGMVSGAAVCGFNFKFQKVILVSHVVHSKFLYESWVVQ